MEPKGPSRVAQKRATRRKPRSVPILPHRGHADADRHVTRMSDVELLGQLRRIVSQADQRRDHSTATQAGELVTVFSACRLRAKVPEWLWEDTRAFVRQHAG